MAETICEALGISEEREKLMDQHIEAVMSSEHEVSGAIMALVDPLCQEDFTEIERHYMAVQIGIVLGEVRAIRSMKSALSGIEGSLF